jgi:hypothetical protein
MRILLVLLFLGGVQTQAQFDNHCFGAKNGEATFDGIQLYGTSGNAYIDAMTIRELTFMNSRYLVYPVLFFYDGDNALSTKVRYSSNGPDGTIAFGFQLFNREIIRDATGASISIIIAHEFGHIAQFKFGGFRNMSNKRKELFADYLAGVYLRARGGLNIESVFSAFESMGDSDFGSADHHGTSQERTDALRQGWIDCNANSFNFPMIKAIEFGKKYVMDIEDDDDSDVVDPK